MADLTDLELVVLGIIWKRGPCTSYAVCKEFVTSPSSYWSGSAGAIYPLVGRLVQRRLVRGAWGRTGRRRHRTYSLTETGEAALRAWLMPPIAPNAAMITYDPLRTRMYFLAMLRPADQRKFLDDAEARLIGERARVDAECRRYRDAGDAFSHLAMRGAAHVIRARLSWIRDVRRALSRA